ncbi:MAG TPA: hypothetical protein VF767_10565 [Bryobacteraceae bacterium]
MKTEDANSNAAACRELELASGRSVVCRPAGSCDELTIRGPEGEVLLEVVLTPKGPVLRFQAAQVQLECQGSFKVRCDSFELETAGDIVQQAGGEMRLEALRGNLDVRANDDVNLNGERVRLNC